MIMTMKGFFRIALSLLCVIACSCQKEARTELLIGTWEVSISYQYDDRYVSTETYDLGTWNYSFMENGKGSYIGVGDTQATDFTYSYNDVRNGILLKAKGTTSELVIDSLSGDRFVFYGYGTSTLGTAVYPITATFRGKKLK